MKPTDQKAIGRRLNTLLRYRSIMSEFDKHYKPYIPISQIYRVFIYPKFFISRDTLYKIFNTDIEKEIQELKNVIAQENEKSRTNTPPK